MGKRKPTTCWPKGSLGKECTRYTFKGTTAYTSTSSTNAASESSSSRAKPFPGVSLFCISSLITFDYRRKAVHLITNMYGLNENKVSALANQVFRYEMDIFKEGVSQEYEFTV
jgi:hypothetical protein